MFMIFLIKKNSYIKIMDLICLISGDISDSSDMTKWKMIHALFDNNLYWFDLKNNAISDEETRFERSNSTFLFEVYKDSSD